MKETKDLPDRSSLGSLRSTTAEENQLIFDLITEEMDATSKTIKQELGKKKVNISYRTIRRRLHETGLQHMRPLSKLLLNERHRQRRIQWAREMKSYD